MGTIRTRTFSAESSSLSSVPTDITLYHDRLASVMERIDEYQADNVTDSTKCILQAFMNGLPQEGRLNLFEDILEVQVPEVKDLASHLYSAILAPMKARGPTPSPHTSPRFAALSSFEDVDDETPDSITRGQQRALRQKCLQRDGNKCVLSGTFNIGALSRKGREAWTPQDARGRHIGNLDVAHIIPFSLGQYSRITRNATATTWQCLYRCFPSLQERLNGAETNEPQNALCLSYPLHQPFGEFQLALEPTSLEHVYSIRTYSGFPTWELDKLPLSRRVTLTTSDPAIPLPDRDLLEVHAAIAKILHASGMAMYIDRVLEDRGDIRCLAEDGSTDVARLLLVSF